jgi:hypothetical protein
MNSTLLFVLIKSVWPTVKLVSDGVRGSLSDLEISGVFASFYGAYFFLSIIYISVAVFNITPCANIVALDAGFYSCLRQADVFTSSLVVAYRYLAFSHFPVFANASAILNQIVLPCNVTIFKPAR